MKHLRTLTRLARQAGATDARIEYGGKHPRIVFTAAGRLRHYTVAGSPSDVRATRNAVAEIRRMVAG